jgi:hypothetical protein
MAQPIAGNQGFTKVENHAGQFGMLNTSELKAAGNAVIGGNLNVSGSLRGEDIVGGLVVTVPAGKTLMKAELQTSSSDNAWFAAGVSRNLVLRSDSTQNFTFPVGTSRIVAARVTATTAFTAVSTAVLDVGNSASTNVASATLINNAVLSAGTSQLGVIGDVIGVSTGAGSTLGSAGAEVGVAAASGEFVTLGAGVAAITAGSANVDVWYY